MAPLLVPRGRDWQHGSPTGSVARLPARLELARRAHALALLVLLSVETSGVWHPGGGVVEVEAAGAVEGLLGGAGGGAAGQDGVFVVVRAGAVEGEAPAGGRADIAQAAQLEHLAVGQDPVDVGEAGAVAHPHLGQVRPAFAGPRGQPPVQGVLRGVRNLRHTLILGARRREDAVDRRRPEGTAMAMTSPYRVVLTEQDRRVLLRCARAARCPHRDVLRARIVLAAADGQANAAIARRLGICAHTVRKWRARFCAEGLAGLADRPRPGRRRIFPATAEAEVKALACALPAEVGVPLARWSAAELAAEAVTRGLVLTVSASTVGRWLAADAIRPWRPHSWILPREPACAVKAARVLALYARLWHGQPLGEDEYVLCADEKTQLQALSRCHRDLPSAPGGIGRTKLECRGGGPLAYLAAYDPHAARVLGRTAPSTGIAPFAELVEQVMSTEPYASAARVFWIVDNGSSHQGPHAVLRMGRTWPTACLVHLSVHASWLNQIEIFFSIVQRKVIKPQNFADLTELTARLPAFQDRYPGPVRERRS